MSEYRYSVHHTDWTDESRTELRHWDEDTAPTTALGRETTPTNDAEAWDAFLAMLVYFGCVPCWDVLVDERARFARTGAARLNGVSVKRVEEPTTDEPTEQQLADGLDWLRDCFADCPPLEGDEIRHHVDKHYEGGWAQFVADGNYAPTQCQWFALCDRVAVTVIAHPVLGDVPACSRCADRYANS